MKKTILAIGVVWVSMLLASSACADSISFSLSGTNLSASGTFYGTQTSPGVWSVTGVAGTFNGSPIIGIDPLADNGQQFYFNNQFYWPGPVFDLYGVVFDLANGDKVNLCYDSGCAGAALTYTAIVWDGSGFAFLNADTSAEFGQPVPEPATIGLLCTGLLGVGGSWLRRRKLELSA